MLSRPEGAFEVKVTKIGEAKSERLIDAPLSPDQLVVVVFGEDPNTGAGSTAQQRSPDPVTMEVASRWAISDLPMPGPP